MIMDILHDSGVWLSFSFVIFMFILVRAGKAGFIGMLDARIEKIKAEIQTAENLRVEAQEMLAQYQRKHRDAMKESEAIIQNAKKRAEEMTRTAEAELEELAKRREQQLKDRLARLEQSAIAEIQKYAADLAIAATKEIINNQLDQASNDSLIEQSIKALPEKTG